MRTARVLPDDLSKAATIASSVCEPPRRLMRADSTTRDSSASLERSRAGASSATPQVSPMRPRALIAARRTTASGADRRLPMAVRAAASARAARLSIIQTCSCGGRLGSSAANTSKAASEVFAAELPNFPPQEQVWMIDSLAARADAAARTAIGNRLSAPDAVVRRAAISAMGRIGDTWGVALLAPALDRSKDAEESRVVESALISLRGGSQTDQAIVAALEKSSGNTRAVLISALAGREGPAANVLLLAEAGQADPVAAKAGLRALAKTGGEMEVAPLLTRLTSTRDAEVRSEAENAAAQAIARIDEPARRSELVREALRRTQSEESRIALLGLLPGCGDAAALAALKAAAVSADAAVRDAVVRALADWPNASAWYALADI